MKYQNKVSKITGLTIRNEYTCLILTNQYMFTTQEESTIAQWIEMFPTCTTADELLAKVMDHMNSFSAKMANPTNLQLAKDTLFFSLTN